jgi:hypothetical protein
MQNSIMYITLNLTIRQNSSKLIKSSKLKEKSNLVCLDLLESLNDICKQVWL